MFPIKRIENIYQELYRYYSQVITFQNETSQYQHIVTKFSENLTELENIIEDMRKYNNNIRDQMIELNK